MNNWSFDEDIKELLNKDDVKCREDVCKLEFQKAQKLLENINEDNLHMAYDINGNLASRFDYIPSILWMADFAEGAMKNMQQASFWYKKAADLGDGNGARCYADLLMSGQGVQANQQEALHYYAIAADKGISEAAFVLSQFLLRSGDKQNALKAAQQAYENGYAPAKALIDKIKGM